MRLIDGQIQCAIRRGAVCPAASSQFSGNLEVSPEIQIRNSFILTEPTSAALNTAHWKVLSTPSAPLTSLPLVAISLPPRL
jgi:hypothetical protein